MSIKRSIVIGELLSSNHVEKEIIDQKDKESTNKVSRKSSIIRGSIQDKSIIKPIGMVAELHKPREFKKRWKNIGDSGIAS